MDDVLTTPQVNLNTPLNKVKKETNPSQGELDGKKLADDFDDFLLLLTTQLQNQDPTEPLDTNEFTSQLVEFASVEQAVATNVNLEKLVSASAATGIQQGLGFIGKSIEAEGSSGVLAEGNATFIYELPQNAASVNVSILDSTGRAVFSGAGNKSAGKNTVVWDGINSLNGQTMADGTYQIVVNARNAKDEKIEAKTFTTGRVTSAEVDAEGTTFLNIGTAKVKADDVIAVREIPQSVKVLPQVQEQAESVVESAFNAIL
jgi:flagellar basal-body rod modification protein FlgD